MRSKFTQITAKQWVDAIKILMGEIDGSRELSMSMNQKLKRQLRGPFAGGMMQQDAVKVIDDLGWRVEVTSFFTQGGNRVKPLSPRF